MTDRKKPEETKLSTEEIEFVERAHAFLENPSLLIRIANKLGKPIEGTLNLLPEKQRKLIHEGVDTALKRGLQIVSSSLPKSPAKSFKSADEGSRSSGLLHSAAAFGTGAMGGLFGAVSLPIELPITTGIMLRSIALIADEFGMDVNDPEVQLECLYILSLGSPGSKEDDAMESAYWTSRVAFSRIIQDAATFLASRAAGQAMREIEKGSAPILVRFIAQVASRFEIVVTEKAIAEIVPAIGAVGGGLINAAFTDYFSEAARYHFGLRSLEKKHGLHAVRSVYERVKPSAETSRV